MTTTTTKRVNVTADQLRQLFDLRRRRLELDRQARAIAAEEKVLVAAVRERLDECGRSEVKRGDFKALIVKGRAYVAWKEEFVRVAGSAAASDVLAAAEPTKSLQVVQVD